MEWTAATRAKPPACTLEKLDEISHVVINDEMLIATPARDDIDPRPVIARTVIETRLGLD
jgi:hypothetical protein